MTNARLEGDDPGDVVEAALETKERRQMKEEALGREARAVLELSVMTQYREKYGEFLWKRFLDTSPDKVEEMQLIRLQLGAMARFFEDMNRFVSGGKAAEHELAQTRDALDAARKPRRVA